MPDADKGKEQRHRHDRGAETERGGHGTAPPSPGGGGSAALGDANGSRECAPDDRLRNRPVQPGWGDGAAAFTPTRRRFASSTSPLQGEVKKGAAALRFTSP